jgi:hypothetical protein
VATGGSAGVWEIGLGWMDGLEWNFMNLDLIMAFIVGF